MKLRKNDNVVVISGAAKGTVGKIVSINPKDQTVVVSKVNIVKKHQKPTQENPDGGIREMEAPIHISKVALNVKSVGATRIGLRTENGKKVRFAKKTGKVL